MKKPDTYQPFWLHEWVQHPMTDEQFRDAFFEYALCKSEDRSLADVRRRARYLINYVCKQEIEEQLLLYRKEHPLD